MSSLYSAIIGGMIAVITIGAMGQGISSLYKSQNDLELRSELTEMSRSLRLRVDCAAILAAAPTPGPAPIILQDGTTWAGPDGRKSGTFHYLANTVAGNVVNLEAAWLADSGATARSKYASNTPADFRRHPVLKSDWNWAFSEQLITKGNPMLKAICGGALAGTPGKYQLECFDQYRCFRINTETGGIQDCGVYPTMYCPPVP